MNKKLMGIVCVLLGAALLVGVLAYTWIEKNESIENAGLAQNAVMEKTFLTYQGTDYPIKQHLQTVLLIGTDSRDPYEEPENSFESYYNYAQADFLLLMVLNKDTNQAELIQLNRDTMMDVPWLDVLGNYGGVRFQQLCRAFNYGDGGPISCKNTVRAVTSLLFDAPIQSYIQVPMSAISAMNDLVGGVPVTFTEDLTAIDPAFAEGATVRLNGQQAEAFLRARTALEDDTNVSRMSRQRVYMDSFQVCAREAFNSDSNFALKVVETLAEYMQSDMTAQHLTDLVEWLDKAEISPMRTPEGELVLGEEYYEFYVNEASQWELVKAAYCES